MDATHIHPLIFLLLDYLKNGTRKRHNERHLKESPSRDKDRRGGFTFPGLRLSPWTYQILNGFSTNGTLNLEFPSLILPSIHSTCGIQITKRDNTLSVPFLLQPSPIAQSFQGGAEISPLSTPLPSCIWCCSCACSCAESRYTLLLASLVPLAFRVGTTAV